jgi:hypothetical protein
MSSESLTGGLAPAIAVPPQMMTEEELQCLLLSLVQIFVIGNSLGRFSPILSVLRQLYSYIQTAHLIVSLWLNFEFTNFDDN